MDSQLVKLWITNEITKIKRRINCYHEPEESGLAKIDVLERLYDFLELDKVTFDITYHKEF
jgi:hypothetical protein